MEHDSNSIRVCRNHTNTYGRHVLSFDLAHALSSHRDYLAHELGNPKWWQDERLAISIEDAFSHIDNATGSPPEVPEPTRREVNDVMIPFTEQALDTYEEVRKAVDEGSRAHGLLYEIMSDDLVDKLRYLLKEQNLDPWSFLTKQLTSIQDCVKSLQTQWERLQANAKSIPSIDSRRLRNKASHRGSTEGCPCGKIIASWAPIWTDAGCPAPDASTSNAGRESSGRCLHQLKSYTSAQRVRRTGMDLERILESTLELEEPRQSSQAEQDNRRDTEADRLVSSVDTIIMVVDLPADSKQGATTPVAADRSSPKAITDNSSLAELDRPGWDDTAELPGRWDPPGSTRKGRNLRKAKQKKAKRAAKRLLTSTGQNSERLFSMSQTTGGIADRVEEESRSSTAATCSRRFSTETTDASEASGVVIELRQHMKEVGEKRGVPDALCSQPSSSSNCCNETKPKWRKLDPKTNFTTTIRDLDERKRALEDSDGNSPVATKTYSEALTFRPRKMGSQDKKQESRQSWQIIKGRRAISAEEYVAGSTELPRKYGFQFKIGQWNNGGLAPLTSNGKKRGKGRKTNRD